MNVHLKEIGSEEVKTIEADVDFWCLVVFCSPKYMRFS
jgi:hypothetical protein